MNKIEELEKLFVDYIEDVEYESPYCAEYYHEKAAKIKKLIEEIKSDQN